MMPRPRLKTAVAAVALGLLALAAGGAYALWGLLGGMCGDTIVAEALSPDQRYKAVVFQRDCGASTGFSTQVSVIGARGALPNEPGSVFTADSNQGAAPASAMGGPVVLVRWDSAHALVIMHHPGARVFMQKKAVSGIAVAYEHF